MERALARPASLLTAFARLDSKRVAATSVAIAVHVVVLMMLLMPVAIAPVLSADDHDIVVVPDIKLRKLIPIPPAPTPVATRVEPKPRTAPVPIPDPPLPPIDDNRAAIDPYLPGMPERSPTDFGKPSSEALIAQISADIAPVPPYPAQGIARRLSGEVVLRIRVDAGGHPVEVTIERSSGSTLLDEAARKFVKARWHFVPATQDGRAIEAFALLPVNYTLPR